MKIEMKRKTWTILIAPGEIEKQTLEQLQQAIVNRKGIMKLIGDLNRHVEKENSGIEGIGHVTGDG